MLFAPLRNKGCGDPDLVYGVFANQLYIHIELAGVMSYSGNLTN